MNHPDDGKNADRIEPEQYRSRGPHLGEAQTRAILNRLDRLDAHQSKGKSTASKTVSLFMVKLAFVGAFSLGSWYVWDIGFQRVAGRCLGPICIHVDAGSTTIGVSYLDNQG